ncbi:hypothetical protein C2845_PM13G02480 [Panicum miliaceum]|uniref:Uncharacterized protein n=1 Tax=Panicum miliaceum TaxID=4540 RepID=A0A3L6RKN2_PANMI|nr:hypothetical protein C2845_PM13G02480 [Panicum miliaceum]
MASARALLVAAVAVAAVFGTARGAATPSARRPGRGTSGPTTPAGLPAPAYSAPATTWSEY